MYRDYIKPLLDILLAIIAIIFLIVPMLLIAIIIKLDSIGGIFFKQKRVGKNKKYFNILKFRTMRNDAPHDVPTHLLNGANSCITKVGAFLRKTSLDELPQLFNILLGQMSFIGPRPALWNQYDLIEERDKYGANNITPGLTGWAQINGRDELPIDIKAKFDGDYVQNENFIFDCKIFLRTIFKVLKCDGVKEGFQIGDVEAKK